MPRNRNLVTIMPSKSSPLKSMLWKASEKGVVQVIRLVFEVVMARLLSASDFGTFTLLLTFVTLSNIAIEGGLGTALIQTDTIEEGDVKTVLSLSFGIALALYVLMLLSAVPIERFYNIVGFSKYLRVMGVCLFVSAYSSVQNALAMRSMHFRSLFISNAVSIVASVAAGVSFAYAGFGIWSLVIQYIIQLLIGCLTLAFIEKQSLISVRAKSSYRRGIKLFGFGWKLMVANLLNRGYGEIYNMVVGKAYSASTLGLYGKGKMFPLAIENSLTSVVTTVMLPVMSRLQDQVDEVRASLKQCVRMIIFIMAPVFLGLAATSDTFVTVVLTDKWLDAAPIMRVICFGVVFQPLSHVTTTAINAVGRSDTVLKLEIMKRTIGLLFLGVALCFSIRAIAVALALSYVVNLALNCSQTERLFGYTMRDMLFDIGPSLLCALVMGFLVYQLRVILVGLSVYAIFPIQILFGALSYCALSMAINPESMRGLLRIIRGQ